MLVAPQGRCKSKLRQEEATGRILTPPLERRLQAAGELCFIVLPHECGVPAVALTQRGGGIKMRPKRPKLTPATVFDNERHAFLNRETKPEFLMLYFAYGSNMDEQRVKAANRCPEARFIFNALLPEHRLVFTHGGDDTACAADAVPDFAACVWGVVYDITESDRRQLDAREAVVIRPYRPKEVLVHPHGDTEQRVMVLTYGAGDSADLERPPTREYLDYLLRGARRWGLPPDYLSQLERIEVSG